MDMNVTFLWLDQLLYPFLHTLLYEVEDQIQET
jgi:hypothetical protein